MRKCRDCNTEISSNYILCGKCKEIALKKSKEKKRIREREKARQHYQRSKTYNTIKPTREPDMDCPWWGIKSCELFKPPICKTKECGFYPPVEAERKRKLRERL
jgi:hypothetical protein